MNTMVLRDTSGGFTFTGINYAVDSETVVRFLKRAGFPAEIAPRPVASVDQPGSARADREARPREVAGADTRPPAARAAAEPSRAPGAARPSSAPSPKRRSSSWRPLTPKRPYDERRVLRSAYDRVRADADRAFSELEKMEREMLGR